MIATDLDNTLLNQDKILSPYTVSILRQCRAKGILIAYATARPQRTLPFLHPDFVPDIVIANNGATVSAGSQIIHRRDIPVSTLHTLLPRLIAQSEVNYLCVECGDYLLTDYPGDDWGPGWNPVHTDFSALPDLPSPKLSTECKHPQALQHVLAGYPELHLYTNIGEDWQQIMHKDATKANGLRAAAAHCGISLGEIVAFGDDSNDIDMLRECGRGVAMGNALDEVKHIADEVCLSHDQDGVAKWLADNL
ncbi:MAG: HAD family hydrolase [Oscillospiraceae bacterium]